MATEACPRVVCTNEMGAPRSSVWLAGPLRSQCAEAAGEIQARAIACLTIFRSKDGAQLHHQDDFGRFPIASRTRNREFNLNLTFTLSGIPPGDYIVKAVLHDTLSAPECMVAVIVRTPCNIMKSSSTAQIVSAAALLPPGSTGQRSGRGRRI